MKFFPSEHARITTIPLMPPDVIARIKALTEKGKFKGTFLVNMFTIQYAPTIPFGIRLPLNPVISGYFSNDKKDIILDYTMSMSGKIIMSVTTFLLPILLFLLYTHTIHVNFSLKTIFLIFYILTALFMYLINILVLHLRTKDMHKKIVIQVLY